MNSLPNCMGVDDAKLTKTQNIANAFNSHFPTIAKNLLAQNKPSQSSSTIFVTNFKNHNTFFINPITYCTRNETHNLYYKTQKLLRMLWYFFSTFARAT